VLCGEVLFKNYAPDVAFTRIRGETLFCSEILQLSTKLKFRKLCIDWSCVRPRRLQLHNCAVVKSEDGDFSFSREEIRL